MDDVEEKEPGCNLCQKQNGGCAVCRGKRCVEWRCDEGTFRFAIKSRRCPACEGTGRCYVCSMRARLAKNSPTGVPLPRSQAEGLCDLLTDDARWTGHLVKLGVRDRTVLEIVGTSENRRRAATLLRDFNDSEAWLLGFFAKANAVPGWEFSSYNSRLQRLGPGGTILLGAQASLEERRVLSRRLAFDARGPFLVIEVAPNQPARFLANFLGCIDIALE